MPYCPVCGTVLMSESCLDARCQQIELAMSEHELALANA